MRSQKRYCVWQLPLLLETMARGNCSGACAELRVTNRELASALAFQCRVGDGDNVKNPGVNHGLLQAIVAGLGRDGASASVGAAGSSWWGANLSAPGGVSAQIPYM
jgi:hypothetical protein